MTAALGIFAGVNCLVMPVLVLFPFYTREVLGTGPEWSGNGGVFDVDRASSSVTARRAWWEPFEADGPCREFPAGLRYYRSAIMRRPGRPLLVLLLVIGVFFLALQLVRPERTNPPVDPAMRIDAHLTVPPDVATILGRSCRDCHTHETRWPWYSHVAPPSLLLAHDVREGRDELNFSEWGDYDEETASDQLEEICEQIRDGVMPLRPYTWLHPEAKLSAADVDRLCQWTEQARAEIAAGTTDD